jgi:hypothetical protein
MKPRLGCEFVMKGQRLHATREAVEAALKGVEPEKVRTKWLIVQGRRYPVRQVFAVAFGIPRGDVNTRTAVKVLRRLGFEVDTSPAETRGEPGSEAERRPKPRFPYTAWMPVTAELQRLDLRAIELKWSPWHPWELLAADDRGGAGVPVPEGTPGVYEAVIEGEPERLAIGKASDLYERVKDSFVRGNHLHPAGEKIRANEDLSRVRVRWAITDRPAAAEEELHQQHRRRFGRLPKYVAHT